MKIISFESVTLTSRSQQRPGMAQSQKIRPTSYILPNINEIYERVFIIYRYITLNAKKNDLDLDIKVMKWVGMVLF